MNRAWAFVRLARPHFLVGGALLYGVGAAAADSVSGGDYLLGQAMVTAAQVTAHFVNEYADIEPDQYVANRTLFSGGSGVLTEGSLAPGVALRAAHVSTVAASILAVAVAGQSASAATLGLVSLGVSWLYSVPPVRLLATGWGEAATSLVVAVLVPLIGLMANGGGSTSRLLWALPVLFLVHLSMMLVFELPDLASDRAAGKTVLAVRLGPNRTHVAIATTLGAGAVTAVAAIVIAEAFSAPVMVAAGMVGTAVLSAARRQRFGLATASAVATLVVSAVAFLLAR